MITTQVFGMSKKSQASFRRTGSSLFGIAVALAVLMLAGPSQAYTEKTLYSFCPAKPCTDGSGPGGLVMDSSGNLFGVTTVGGKNGDAVVYEFVPGTAQESVLYNFCSKTGCADGSEPGRVNLVIDTRGNLYGTASMGGSANDAGVVFELHGR